MKLYEWYYVVRVLVIAPHTIKSSNITWH